MKTSFVWNFIRKKQALFVILEEKKFLIVVSSLLNVYVWPWRRQHATTILLKTLLQGNTLKCSVEDIERFRPRVWDDDTRSLLDVRFKMFFEIYY